MVVKPGYKQTEVGVIPEEWDCLTIGECASIRTGSKNTEDKVDNGLYPFFVRSQRVERINSFAFDCEAVLTAGDGVGTGKVFHYITGRFDVHQRVYVMSDFINIIGRYFLYYFSDNFYNEVRKFTAKSSVDSVRMDMIAEMLLPVPPLAEQQAIATFLSDVDRLIQFQAILINKKRNIKRGAMQELLTGRKRLDEFSGEWEKTRLGEHLEFQVGYPFKSKHFNQNQIGIRLVKNRDLKSDDQVWHYSGEFLDDYLISDADVLIGMDGEFLPCLWDKGTALLNQRVGRILVDKHFDLRFVRYILIAPLAELQRGTAATTVKHLSHNDVENLVLNMPQSKQEQTAIANILSDMDAEIEALEQKKAKYTALKRGMMRELLTGRIRLI